MGRSALVIDDQNLALKQVVVNFPAVSKNDVLFRHIRQCSRLKISDSGGNQHDTAAYRAFDFVFMHQNYHRGQISQNLDDLGIPHSFADNRAFSRDENIRH
jgi:uncharacterized damage-inducible protein DinB